MSRLNHHDIPHTWRDVTDDVCPRPRHGLRPPTPDEMRDADMGLRVTPRVEEATKRNGAVPKDFSDVWQGRYPSEREWLIALLQEHRTCGRVATVIGVGKTWVVQRAKLHKLPMMPRRGYVG